MGISLLPYIFLTETFKINRWSDKVILSHLSPLTSEIVGAPQMTLQQYLSILPCLPLPSGNLQTPFPSIHWCYLSISYYSVFLSCLLLSLSPAELPSPCPRILRFGHTIWVSLPWLGDHHARHHALQWKLQKFINVFEFMSKPLWGRRQLSVSRPYVDLRRLPKLGVGEFKEFYKAEGGGSES